MIELTYIFHSCFILETEKCILIFDYWMDPSDAMRRVFAKIGSKHIYVFASHFHEDHFNREILKWRSEKTSARFTYILSKDILRHRRTGKEDADVWLAKGGVWKDGDIKVTATGSNDSGVSWIVEVEGRKIFHAGDLCNWYARFLTGNTSEKTIYSEESGICVNPVTEEKRFLGELKDIRKITGYFDIVMFPVDGRIGNGYTLGARQFIERFKVGLFVPMHFVMSGFESAWRMEPFCNGKDIPFWRIGNEGESACISQNNLIIRQSTLEDIPQIQTIFTFARKFMTETGNPNQWEANYPNDALLHEDIESGDSHVIQKDNGIVATFLLRDGVDQTYNIIYDGKWLNNAPYATIHRIAGNGEVNGIFHLVMQFALRHYSNIRIDTHRDNMVMQNAIKKEGFTYCGIIHCRDGSERLAYQYTKESASRQFYVLNA